MLQTIRDRATGWIAYIIVGLLIIPFALWGVNQYFGEPQSLEVATVGDTTISLQEFQQAYQQHRLRLQNLLGENFDPALFDETRLKQEVLQQLVNEAVLAQAARNEGLRVGDGQLHEVIRAYEAFQQDGAFNPELYQRVLRSQGYSPLGFEESLRSSLVSDQLREGLVASSFVTLDEMNRLIGLLTQKRELSYVVLSLDDYLNQTSVDEAAVEAYFEEHKDRFRSPEQVRLQYLELKVEQLAEHVPVSEDELQAAYQEQIARYGQQEERRASHILVTVPKAADKAELDKARTQAKEIYDAIASGAKTFEQALQEAQTAEAGAIEGGELGVISKGMLDPAFENSLFALEAVGDISEPVQTPFGVHIIRLDEIIPAQVKSLAEVRDEVAQELRQRQAESRFYDAVETLANLSYEHPDTLEPAAKALGLEIAESPWFTRQSSEGIAAYPQVVAAAFSEDVLRRGLNSEPLEVEPGHVVVLRVEGHQEAAPLPLEEARDDIIDQLRNDQARAMLQKEAETLQARASQGESLEALAEEFGGELKQTGLVDRNDATIAGPVLVEAFQLPEPDQNQPSVGSAVLDNGDRAVIVVSRVLPGTAQDLEEAERIALEQRLAGQIGVTQFEAFLNSLRQQVEVVTYLGRL